MKNTTESTKRDPIKRANDLLELAGSILFLLWIIDIVTHGQARFVLRRFFTDSPRPRRNPLPTPQDVTAMHQEAERIIRSGE